MLLFNSLNATILEVRNQYEAHIISGRSKTQSAFPKAHQKEGTTGLEDIIILVQNRPLVTHKAQVLFSQIDLELD